jgi:hypothetical protein
MAQHIHRGHQHTGRTNSTLRRPVSVERGTQSHQHRVIRFRRCFDFLPGCLSCGHKARADLLIVQQDRAGPAIPSITANLDRSNAALIPQNPA